MFRRWSSDYIIGVQKLFNTTTKRCLRRSDASSLFVGLAGASPLHPQYACWIPVLYTSFIPVILHSHILYTVFIQAYNMPKAWVCSAFKYFTPVSIPSIQNTMAFGMVFCNCSLHILHPALSVIYHIYLHNALPKLFGGSLQVFNHPPLSSPTIYSKTVLMFWYICLQKSLSFKSLIFFNFFPPLQ